MTNKLTAIGVIAALLLLCAALSLVFLAGQHAHASVFSQTNIGYTASTSAAFSVTTSVRILATTTPNPVGGRYTRVFAAICNASVNPVAIALNGDLPVSATNITGFVGANSCYEITDRNGYQGSVTASSTNGSAALISVEDYVQ